MYYWLYNSSSSEGLGHCDSKGGFVEWQSLFLKELLKILITQGPSYQLPYEDHTLIRVLLPAFSPSWPADKDLVT